MDRDFFGRHATECHMCKGNNLNTVLDLGKQPHSDDFLTTERCNEVEHFFPLRLCSCADCGLLQIDYFVNPEILYQKNYIYESSITSNGVNHYHAMAKEIAEQFDFSDGDLAIDIGSNVGVLLSGFKKQGFSVLGVDPAETVAQKAIDGGIETIIDFFHSEVAQEIEKSHGKAKVITGTNVFAHLHEIDSAVEGIKLLLDEDGVVVIEAPYAIDFVKNNEYDTIYHQHIGYLSVKPMQKYFDRFDLELFNVEQQDIHGGTLRYYVGHKEKHPVTEAVSDALKKEEDEGIYDLKKLETFSKAVQEQRRSLITLLNKLKSEGNNIVGISAPAKGNTLLNYCGINTEYLNYITEKSQLKQGLYTPGTNIPIYSDERLLEDQPEYAIILAWNFSEEIMNNLAEFKKRGGKFIIPIPTPKII